MPSIDILLSTFNGEKFLEEQLVSLFAQDHVSCRIIARDDGSKDACFEILKKWHAQYPERILLDQDTTHLGLIPSMNRLSAFSTAPYIAFADQDDVWLTHKLSCKLKLIEHQTEPALVHCDLKVVDETLETLHESFWQSTQIQPHTTLPRLLSNPTVTACATLINRPLFLQSFPIPTAAVMHDYYISLIAKMIGHTFVCSEPLILYRQHQHNTIGAHPKRSLHTIVRNERRKIEQARALREHLSIPCDMLDVFIHQYDLSYWSRIFALHRHKIYKASLLGNLCYQLLMPFLYKKNRLTKHI